MKPSVMFILASQVLLNENTEACCNKKKIIIDTKIFIQDTLKTTCLYQKKNGIKLDIMMS